MHREYVNQVRKIMKFLSSRPKSLYRIRAGRQLYGTENDIWAGFGPVGNTEKKLGANYEQLLRVVFSCFQGQKMILDFVLKHCSVLMK